VPGYTGYIPGVKAENLFSKTYANNTSHSFGGHFQRTPRNFDYSNPEERFRTTHATEHSPERQRRIAENPDKFLSRRDYLEYTIQLNEDMSDRRNCFIQSAGNVRVNKTLDLEGTISPKKFSYDLKGSPVYDVAKVQVRPRLLQANLANSPRFQALSPGFRRIFTD
jgi:hypothetical protein